MTTFRMGAALAALAATTAAAQPTAAPRAVIVLDAGGLVITPAAGGAPRKVAFGTPQASALAAIAAVLGRGTVGKEPEECGMGPTAMHADFRNGLQVQFQRGRMIGWSIEQASTLRTADGIGLGTPRATLVRLRPRATFEDTDTLGYQFAVPGGISGGLTDSGARATVDFLSAGSHCVIS